MKETPPSVAAIRMKPPNEMPPAPSAFALILTDARTAPMFVAALFFGSVALYWHGFGPGDPERYVRAALDWNENRFNLGETHWSLRLPIVLPIAGAFALLGANEFAATLPNILYAGGLVAVTFLFMRRYVGRLEGTIAAAFIATSAFFVARPIELDGYGAEALYVAAACWFFVASGMERRRYLLLFAAGFAAGFAWLVREQTLFLMAAFGLLTLMSRKDLLRSLFALGCGFGLVIAAELIFYAIGAGDPLYRYEIDLNHRNIGREIAIEGEDASLFNRLVRPIKDLLASPTTTPFLALAAIAMVGLGWRTAREPEGRRRTFTTFCVAAAIAVPVCAYAFNLALPRYYSIFTYAVFLVLALATAEIARRRGPLPAIGFAALVTFLNIAAADFSRYGEYAEARRLATIAARSAETIETDPLTASRARYQMVLRGFSLRDASSRIVMTDRPTVGGLYFKSHVVARRPSHWCAIEVADVRPFNWTHYLIRKSGLSAIAGAKIRSIVADPAPVELVRVLEGPATSDPATGKACLRAER